MKKCGRCKLFKDSVAFSKKRGNIDGLYGFCKVCTRAINTSWYYKNTDKVREISSKRHWRNYGIVFNLDDYNKMFLKQEGLCAVCGLTEKRANRPLSVDHNHTTKRVRGLLCDACNRKVVATVESYPDLISKAILYLEKANA